MYPTIAFTHFLEVSICWLPVSEGLRMGLEVTSSVHIIAKQLLATVFEITADALG